jgi:hypothetical protein
MTRFEELVSKAQYALCVVGNPSTDQYELLDFPLPDEAGLIERGMVFVGVLALVEWVPRSALAMPLGGDVIKRLSDSFTERLLAAARTKSEGDSVGWLARLHEVPDPRDWN